MDFNNLYDNLSQSWQIKCFASFLINIFSFLIGEINASFVALWTLIVIDTLTKWIAVSGNVRDQYAPKDSVFYGMLLAWKSGELSSRNMRRMFAGKVFSYLILIIVANLLVKIIPGVMIFGNDWVNFPSGFIYTFLALTEMMSIIENLIGMGVDALKPLAWFVERKRNEMVGGEQKNNGNPIEH